MSSTVLKPGARFKSAVSDAQVMVIKAPPGEHALSCGGAAMLVASADAGDAQLDATDLGEVLIGKRYVNPDESLELLCTKGGKGSLSCNGGLLEIKQAKQLPSSD